MTINRKVLIITYAFFPMNTAGIYRIASFGKHLSSFGWEPVILCPNWTAENTKGKGIRDYDPTLLGKDPCEVVRAPLSVPRQGTLAGWWVRKKWKHADREDLKVGFRPLFENLLNCGRKALTKGGLDAILSSAFPYSTLHIAGILSEEFKIPWVADFRDLCDQGYDLNPDDLPRMIQAEKEVAASAAALTTVSEPLADLLRSRYDQPVHVVLNGFNPDDYRIEAAPLSDKFIISYCGVFGPGRDPLPVFDALDYAVRKDKNGLNDLEVRFYGISATKLGRLVWNRPCNRHVKAMGYVEREKILVVQKSSDALLLMSHSTGVGIMTSKIFEYLGSGRPILSIPGDEGGTDALLRETNAGYIADTPEKFMVLLDIWLKEWRKNGKIEPERDEAAIRKYTRESQARNLAYVLNSVVSGSNFKA
jgi:glycosyltransferase involved in cell wall biosynthesis